MGDGWNVCCGRMARKSSQDGRRPDAYRLLFRILFGCAVELHRWSQVRLEGPVRSRRGASSSDRFHPLRGNRTGPLGPQSRTDQVMVGDAVVFHAFFANLSSAHDLELLVRIGVDCWLVGGG